MCSARIGLSWLMVVLVVTPLVGQTPPGMVQGGTYNAPAGAGAVPPALPSLPLGGQQFGQPAFMPPQGFPYSNQGNWLQLLQQGRKGVRPREREGRAFIKVRVPTADTQL